MKHETLFTASKWDILTVLRNGEHSPVQLAETLDTSVANVSQQLRLLEMAGLVASKRVAHAEQGKPRVLYSLNGDQSYIITAAEDFVTKEFHDLSERNKAVLRIWFADSQYQYFLEKAFWQVEEQIDTGTGLLVDVSEPEFRVVGDSAEYTDVTVTDPDDRTETVAVTTGTPNSERYMPLYDPEDIL